MATKVFFLLLLAASQAWSGAAAPLGEGLFLPQGVKASWLLKPGEELPKDTLFDIEAGGKAWLLPHPRLLRLPGGESLPMKEEVKDILFTPQGKLMLLSERAAGPLELSTPDEEGRRWGRVKEKLLLPGPGWRLAEGGPEGSLAYGFDPESGSYLAYRLRDRRKLLESKERIQAIRAEGNGLVASISGRLFRVQEGSEPKPMEGPAEGVTGLALVEGLGLVASTPKGLAWLRPSKTPLPLLSSPYPRLRARGAELYVMLRQGGILKLDGLEALKSIP